MDIEPGIYLDMTDEEYFSQRALGSTDMKALFLDAESWWWEMHPDSPLRKKESEDDLKKRADARRFGHAVHACVLEGVTTYESRFGVMPERSDHKGALITAPGLQKWLKAKGEKATGLKPDLIERVLSIDPDAPIWDAIVDKAIAGRQVVYKSEDLRLRFMRRIIENDAELIDQISPGLSEVAVFWRDSITGKMHRAKFDRISATMPWDVKTFARRRSRRPRTGAIYRAGDEQYHVQVAHYWEAWDLLPDLPVIGGTDEQRGILDSIRSAIAAGESKRRFGWLFCPVNGAPTPLALRLNRDGVITQEGENRLKEAKESYRSWARVYGDDTPWIETAGVQDIDDEHEGYGFTRAA